MWKSSFELNAPSYFTLFVNALALTNKFSMSQEKTVKKILILSANPKDTNKLRLDEEVREIEAALERAKNRDKFNIVSKWAVRIDDLRRTLLDYKPNIVHFCGHGAGIEGLALEDNSGITQLVSREALANLFELFRGTVECVLLNACYSEVQAQAIYQHADYVIGMNQPIGDVAAIEFATGFYDALGAGESYDYAFRMGCASIYLKGNQEYSTPVLKSRPSSPSISAKKTEQVSEDKPQVSNQLSKDLDVPTQSTEPSRKQNQVNNLSGINAGGNFNYAPVQASGNVTSWSSFNKTKNEDTDFQKLFSLMEQLKQDINQSENLNPLLKAGAKEQVEKLKQELKKPEPNKGLIQQIINILKQGFEEFIGLAETTEKIVYLVATIWGVTV